MKKNLLYSLLTLVISLTFGLLFITGCKKGHEENLPVLTTNDVSSITGNSAVSGGMITSEGLGTVISRGVCWSTGNTPTIDDSKTSNGTGLGTFTSNIPGLIKGTKYFLRAYASNSVGTGYGNVISFTTNGTVTDIDGNVYTTITIGTQEWMGENLKVTHYSNGDGIPNVTNTSSWVDQGNSNIGIYCDYENSPSNSSTYGRLYNWYAAVDSRKIAPVGWRVPADAEWTILENYLIANKYNYDGTNIGNKIAKALASTTNWTSSSTVGAPGNIDYPTYRNKSGFTALPGGYRNYNPAFPTFSSIGIYGFWWCSSSYANGAYERYLNYNSSNMTKSGYSELYGYSIRCVKD